MTQYLTKAEHRAERSRLTRAVNSGEPVRTLLAVEHALDTWTGKAWPDDWHRWARALDDAYFEYVRNVDNDGSAIPRFRAAFGRLF